MISPVDEVQAISSGDDVSAGRLRLELERDLTSPHLRPEDRAELQEAIAELDQRFPRHREMAMTAREEELGGLGTQLRKTRHEMRRRSGMTHRDAIAARGRRERREGKPDEPSSPARVSRRSSGRRGVPVSRGARRAWGRTGIPATAGSASGIGLQALGVLVGLSLVYLLVNERGGGPKALATLIQGIGTGTEIFLGPYDPLGGAGQLKGPTIHAAPGRRAAPLTYEQLIRAGVVAGPPSSTHPARQGSKTSTNPAGGPGYHGGF